MRCIFIQVSGWTKPEAKFIYSLVWINVVRTWLVHPVSSWSQGQTGLCPLLKWPGCCGLWLFNHEMHTSLVLTSSLPGIGRTTECRCCHIRTGQVILNFLTPIHLHLRCKSCLMVNKWRQGWRKSRLWKVTLSLFSFGDAEFLVLHL